MKINYKNTALCLLDDPKNFGFGFPDPDITPQLTPAELIKFGKSIIANADMLKEICGHNIQYVSHSFFEAFAKGRHKLYDAIRNEEIEDSGTLILGNDSGNYTHWHTYFYYVKCFKADDGTMNYDLLFMDFSKHAKASKCALDIYTSMHTETSSLKHLIWNGYLNEGRDIAWWEAFIISFVFFKKYCDIETKIIPANKKDNHIGVKYVNNTNRKITVLDSTWFTTIVKSDGFGVRGHFRFQPCGPGNTMRKLIWIDAFEKEGYVRQAKVLNQNTNQSNDGT